MPRRGKIGTQGERAAKELLRFRALAELQHGHSISRDGLWIGRLETHDLREKALGVGRSVHQEHCAPIQKQDGWIVARAGERSVRGADRIGLAAELSVGECEHGKAVADLRLSSHGVLEEGKRIGRTSLFGEHAAEEYHCVGARGIDLQSAPKR